jgi:hypothetical protein
MRTLRTHGLVAVAFVIVAAGCARQFPGPVRPRNEAQQAEGMTVLDDGTISYILERLEISLRPMTDAELNRLFPQNSNSGAESTNPYTYGNWTPLGESYTPQRFTVFQLRTKNYEFPKVRVNPDRAVLRTQNRRTYESLDKLRLGEYYRSHAQAWAGNAFRRYRAAEETLRRTTYRGDMIFSGQEDEGFLVFEPLPTDVTSFTVTLEDVSLRFNYADEPVETTQLTYEFERDIFSGYQPLEEALATQ